MADKHIAIIGAGPGGLTSGMLLAKRGFKVTIFEKDAVVGGRNQTLTVGDYRFDVGPTFLMMKFVLDEVFKDVGLDSEDHIEFQKLDPMYRLQFKDFTLEPSADPEETKKRIKDIFPGSEAGVDKFLKKEGRRFRFMYPCLQKSYSSFWSLLHPTFVKASPFFLTPKSLFSILHGYFKQDDLSICFTFQSKYLGMSPWECPGAFTIIPYIEHAFGVYHTKGGLSAISEAMEKIVIEAGAEVRLSTPVKEVLVENGVAKGVLLEDGSKVEADEVVLGSDFAYSMDKLVSAGTLRKYSPENLKKMEYSCSTFMIYLGVKKTYDLPHHTIVFADDYKINIEDIFNRKIIPEMNSCYVRNASVNDPTLAPEGHSNLYLLVPVPNNTSGIDWEKEKKPFRDRILAMLEERTVMKDLRENIVAEEVITPLEWESKYNVYLGATFNLAHTMGQMMYFRPHNRFNEIGNCWLVGGGTHPGSGLPTIYESGRITANMLSKKHGVEFKRPRPLPPNMLP